MKIAFLTEGTFEGKYPRNHPNARVDVAWQIALDAYHLPMYTNWSNPIDHYEFDLAIWIIPKKNIDYVMNQEDYITSLKKISKKVAIMQEGPSWFFQDYPLDQQIWFYNQLCSVDIIYAHNYNDKKYFEGLTNHQDVRLMTSVMIEDSIDQERIIVPTGRKNVIIGGNQCRWYGGFDSFIVAQQFLTPIYAPAMGRKIAGEEQIVNILPYVQWNEWIVQLSQFKYGVHLMPTQAAGTFALNCAYLGIPNIGYRGLDTQEVLHPNLTVEMGDLLKAKRLAQMLEEDKDFYEEQSRIARHNYELTYTEESFKISFYDKFN
jgi:hypothetical protein